LTSLSIGSKALRDADLFVFLRRRLRLCYPETASIFWTAGRLCALTAGNDGRCNFSPH
jgi:hypothetical protein